MSRLPGALIVGNEPDLGVGSSLQLPCGLSNLSFSPLNISGLLAWYRADMGITLNGSDVSAWADQGTSGDTNRNATQADAAKQPTYTSSNASYNNRPTVDFTGSTDGLKTGVWSSAPSQPVTILVCGNVSEPSGTRYLFDGISAFRCAVITDSSLTRLYAGSLVNASTTITSASVVGCEFNTTSSKIYINSTTAAASGDAGSLNSTGLTIGNYQGLNVSCGGSIAELIVYSGVLSANNLRAVMNYLGSRYGVAIS